MSGLEKKLEAQFVKWCNANDIVPIKGPTATSKGFPDRFFQLPNGGGTMYVEFKGDDTYYGLTPLQKWWGEYLKASNPNRYFVVDSQEQLSNLLERINRLIAIGNQLVEYETKLIFDDTVLR